jgi:hypothetical protein
MASLKVIQDSERTARAKPRFPRPFDSEKQIEAKVGRAPSAASMPEESQMSTRTDAVAPWPWRTTTRVITPTKVGYATKPGHEELWAGAAYLMVWSLLWLAVIVTVLAPLEGLFGGAR